MAKVSRFVELVYSWWNSFKVLGRVGQKMRLKLKLLRDKLKAWNKEVFRCIEEKKKRFREKFKGWGCSEEHIALNGEERC